MATKQSKQIKKCLNGVQKFSMYQWIMKHKDTVKGMTLAEIAKLIQKDLQFDVTDSNVRWLLRSAGIANTPRVMSNGKANPISSTVARSILSIRSALIKFGIEEMLDPEDIGVLHKLSGNK